MIRKSFYNLIIFLMVLAMAGCSMSNILPTPQDGIHDEIEDGENIPPQSVEPTVGGRLRLPISNPGETNPLFAKSKDFINFSWLIYEGLFAYDENLKPVPVLVESWEVSDEGKLWQFRLRSGIKWHHGEELTAQDVKYTIDLLMEELQRTDGGGELSLYANRLFNGRDIERIEPAINDPYSFSIVLTKPVGRTLIEALTFPILSANDKEQDLSGGGDSLNGTGPYRVDSGTLKVGEQINLVRNKDWWGSPKPYIDSIEVKIYKNSTQSLEGFKKGEVDAVDTHALHAEYYGLGRGVQLFPYLTQSFNYIGINHKSPGVLGDSAVRQAIAYAIDKKGITSRVYAGNAQTVDFPIPPDAWYYDSDLRVFDYQPLKAKQLLEEAGWQDSNDDGILDNGDEKDPVNLGFTVNAYMDNVLHKETLNLISKQLLEVGIEVKIRLLSWEEYLIALEEGDFEAVFCEYYPDIVTDLKQFFYSSQIPNGFNNYGGYSNVELDRLLDELPLINDPEEFRDNYKDMQKILMEDLPIISLYYRTSSLIASEKIHGIKTPRELTVFRGIERWYLGS